ncbi:hypothetical protein ENUP19_0257G0064 [Entamoeba nuttalli]|uniref:Uncharacterized protein n=2 Tax=Entamoeba nuttalli TaxID=412467 RepID=K2HA73_ENTNP|nr:hypothetical protein ENU1_126280 [Entamoeba nuttalli P19]EKE39484.1 hypothetical protein ENU1_126280 [Entamoeba nuttalli P19]|eukprot:XP_008858181.1 hypothetical protein ENU1_126280 [Entamoeba nuttalli P19]
MSQSIKLDKFLYEKNLRDKVISFFNLFQSNCFEDITDICLLNQIKFIQFCQELNSSLTIGLFNYKELIVPNFLFLIKICLRIKDICKVLDYEYLSFWNIMVNSLNPYFNMEYRKVAFELLLEFIYKSHRKNKLVANLLTNAFNLKVFELNTEIINLEIPPFSQEFSNDFNKNKSLDILQNESLVIIRLFIHFVLSSDDYFQCFIPFISILIGNIFPSLIPLISITEREVFNDSFVLTQTNPLLIKLFLSFFLINSTRFAYLAKVDDFCHIFIGIVNIVLQLSWNFKECHDILRPSLQWYFSILFWRDIKTLKSTFKQSTLEFIQQSFITKIQEFIESNISYFGADETAKTINNDIIQLIAIVYPKVYDNSLVILNSSEHILFNYLTILNKQQEMIKKFQAQTTRQLVMCIIILYIRFYDNVIERWGLGEQSLIYRLSEFYNINGVIDTLAEMYGHVVYYILTKLSKIKQKNKNVMIIKSLLSYNFAYHLPSLTINSSLIQEQCSNSSIIICYQSSLLKPYTEHWEEKELKYYFSLLTQTFSIYGLNGSVKYYRNVNTMLYQVCLIFFQATKEIQHKFDLVELFFDHIFNLQFSQDLFISRLCIPPIIHFFHLLNNTPELILCLASMISDSSIESFLLIVDNILPFYFCQQYGIVQLIWNTFDKLILLFNNEINKITTYLSHPSEKEEVSTTVSNKEICNFLSPHFDSHLTDLLHFLFSLLQSLDFCLNEIQIKKIQECYILASKLPVSLCNHKEVMWSCCMTFIMIENQLNLNEVNDDIIIKQQEDLFNCLLNDCTKENDEYTDNIILIVEIIAKESFKFTNRIIDYIISSLLDKCNFDKSLKVQIVSILMIQKILFFNSKALTSISNKTMSRLFNTITLNYENIPFLKNENLQLGYAYDIVFCTFTQYDCGKVDINFLKSLKAITHIVKIHQIISLYQNSDKSIFLVIRNVFGINIFEVHQVVLPNNTIDIGDKHKNISLISYEEKDILKDTFEETNTEIPTSFDNDIENDLLEYSLNDYFKTEYNLFQNTEECSDFKEKKIMDLLNEIKNITNLDNSIINQHQNESSKIEKGYNLSQQAFVILNDLFNLNNTLIYNLDINKYQMLIDQLDSISLNKCYCVGVVYISDETLTINKLIQLKTEPNSSYFSFINLLGKSKGNEVIEYKSQYQTIHYLDYYQILKTQTTNIDEVLYNNVLIVFTTFTGYKPTHLLNSKIKIVFVVCLINNIYHISIWQYKKLGIGVIQNNSVLSPCNVKSFFSYSILSINSYLSDSENLLMERESILNKILCVSSKLDVGLNSQK